MSKNQSDSLGDRMKKYEATSKTELLRRTPVLIRLDGRAFHTFVPAIKKIDPSVGMSPFSQIMHEVMVGTMAALVDNVQNSVFAYTQSDEISILLRDWDFHETQQWFKGGVQKMASIAASIASNAFNYQLSKYRAPRSFSDLAQFDARVFNLPKEEVTNYFIWRQQDASRNSVQMLGHHIIGHKGMQGLSNSRVQDALMLQHGINWNNLPTWMKRGTCTTSGMIVAADKDIPVFTQDRNYVERHLTPPPIIVKTETVLTTTAEPKDGWYTMTVNPVAQDGPVIINTPFRA